MEVEYQSGHVAKAVILSATQFEQAMAFFQANGYGAAPLKVEAEKEAAPHTKGETTLADILSVLLSWKGQDLHLSAGAVPSVRVDNEIRRLSLPALKPSELEHMVLDVLTPEQRRIFWSTLELDFAFSLHGVGRFRCNLYRQRNSSAFTARHVSESIPSAAALGVPRAGISSQYIWQESELIIDNIMVGFNNGPMLNVDEVIRIDKAMASASVINSRPDIWLFPFLNVYGLFMKAKTSTAIDASVWIPDVDSNWTQLTAFSTKANFDATGVGFGLTPTIGISRYWLALDMNFAWT